MPAYAIAAISIQSRDWLSEYSARADALIAKHGGRYVVRGGETARLEGKVNPPDILLILEFPSMNAAKAWHADPDYQPLIDIRNRGSATEFILAEGV